MHNDRTLSALLSYTRQLVVGMSQGRRRNCAAMLGDGRDFATNIHDVFLPWPLPSDMDDSLLSLGLALQCSPTKETIAQLPLSGLTKGEETALRWVEAEGAIAWIIDTLPGLARDAEYVLPQVNAADLQGLSTHALMERVLNRANAGPYVDLPSLFGQLPIVESAISTWTSKKMKIEGRLPWSDEGVRLERLASNSSAIGGSEGEFVDRATAMQIDEIIGDDRGVAFGRSYPEWNMFENVYIPDYAIVKEVPLKGDAKPDRTRLDPRLYDFFREPLQKVSIGRQEDGAELDLDTLIDTMIDSQAGVEHRSYFYMDRVTAKRDAVCAILIDRSMSLNQAKLLEHELDIAKALSEALIRTGERHAIFAFHSDTRHKVVVNILRGFNDNNMFKMAASQIPPAGYTRIGPALRHVATRIGHEQAARKLIIVLSDGEPCDEGYEGHYAAADVAKAVEEAERDGINIAFISVSPSGGQRLAERIGHQFIRLSRASQLAPALANLRSRLVL